MIYIIKDLWHKYYWISHNDTNADDEIDNLQKYVITELELVKEIPGTIKELWTYQFLLRHTCVQNQWYKDSKLLKEIVKSWDLTDKEDFTYKTKGDFTKQPLVLKKDYTDWDFKDVVRDVFTTAYPSLRHDFTPEELAKANGTYDPNKDYTDTVIEWRG